MSRYGAFISYSRQRDQKLAVALQSGVERFGRRWNRARVVRVFRDDSSLSANAGLWSSIEDALGSSGWFVLLASPEAAASKWVNREIEWWLANANADHILLVLTAGELVWSEAKGDFDQQLSTALPPALVGAFREEPRYVDATWSRSQELISDASPQLLDATADVSAAVRGIPKDELVGEAARQQGRTKRIIRSVAVGFLVLFAVVVAAAAIALKQRSSAQREAKTSQSRLLAATSESVSSSDLETGLLLAVQAYETEPNSATRAALMRASTASPHLSQFVQFPDRLTAIGTSRNGDFAVIGLTDGTVDLVDLTDTRSEPSRLFTMDSEVGSVAVSDEGDAVVASDGKEARLWDANDEDSSSNLQLPDGHEAGEVGIAESGDTVAAASSRPTGFRGSISIFSGDTGQVQATHGVDVGLVEAIQFPTEGQLGLYNAYGTWEERQVSDWKLLWTRTIGYGAHEAAGQPSDDGRWITASNGADSTPVWSTTAGARDRDPPDLTAEVSLTAFPEAVAVGPDGSSAAIAASGVIRVAPLAPPGQDRPDAIDLTGGGAVTTGLMRFAGDDEHLVSASGNRLAIWDLTQLDRLATVTRMPDLGISCSACGTPALAVAPDGSDLAVALDSGTALSSSALIQPLGLSPRKAESVGDDTFAGPVWASDGSFVSFPLVTRAVLSQGPTDAPSNTRTWKALGVDESGVDTTGPGPDSTVVVVNSNGTIRQYDGDSGEEIAEIPAPPNLGTDSVSDASVEASGERVALLYPANLSIIDVGSGETAKQVPADDITHVAYAGNKLLIQRDDGTLEVWNSVASQRERTLPGDETYLYQPVGSPDGTLVARQHADGEITVLSLVDGSTLGSFQIPPEAEYVKTGIVFGPTSLTLDTVTEGSNGGYLVQRDLTSENLAAAACETAGRALTDDELTRLVGSGNPDSLACDP